MKINILNSIFNKKYDFLIDNEKRTQISLINYFFMV